MSFKINKVNGQYCIHNVGLGYLHEDLSIYSWTRPDFMYDTRKGEVVWKLIEEEK